jgi:hypothetical protein
MTTSSTSKTELRRNNLDRSSSPYLLQHRSNPVWWQEWSNDLIKYAVEIDRPLFVSIGYSTCHWCHVMASEAFSDIGTAQYLNDHFICIKVDREQRPDIDQFLMDFINTQNGRGGWPLNVFITPGLNPVFALTYAPVSTRDSMLSLLTIAEKVIAFLELNRDKIPPFNSIENKPAVADEATLAKSLSEFYDPENGGFGVGQKFPPHSTLLYLLYQLGNYDSPTIKSICFKTLDAMRLRGLHDHLQGGIFRYCVDKEWIIPHFEKMLYDQAMALWCYSLAYRVLGKEEYKTMAKNIIRCLDDSFESDGFYISAHDADTGHAEGATYLWSFDELKRVLLPEEFSKLCETYFIEDDGNFEGLNHLIRINDNPLNNIEEKLLSIRKRREQPSRDDKIQCGINSLVAIALIQAGRFIGDPTFEAKASSSVHKLIDRFWDGKTLGHSIYGKKLQNQEFLFDAAALLTAITFLYENDDSWSSLMNDLAGYVESFNEDGRWIESRAPDFKTVYASWFDHPVPSSVSLAEMGLIRVAHLTGKSIDQASYRKPFHSDFYNISVMMRNGQFHIIESSGILPWSDLPVTSIQVRGPNDTDCYMGTCSPITATILKK